MAGGETLLQFSEEGKVVRRRLEARHLEMVGTEVISPKMGAHFGKYDGIFARLCVLWHCIEHIDARPMPTIVSGATAGRVEAFLHRFIVPSAIAFYSGTLGLSDDHDTLIELASYRDLRTTLATTDKDSIEYKIAQQQLDALPKQKIADQQNINRQNECAGASYLRSLNLDKPQFIQSEEVKLLEDFNTGLDDSVKKALHLHGIFGDIIGDLIDMAIRQALIKPIAGALFSGGDSGGGGGSGFLGSVLGAVGLGGHTLGGSSISNSLFGLLSQGNGVSGARAAGGPVAAGRAYLVGEKGPEIVKFGANGTVYPNGVSPNVAASNERISGATPQITVLAPRHYDLTNSLIDRNTLAQMNAENRAYTDAVGRAAYGQAVQTANRNVPGVVSRRQTLGTE